MEKQNKVDLITAIASKRGFFFQTADIYGGRGGFFTYGHLGKAIKNNFESLWRKYFLSLNDNFYEIQSNNILPEQVFIASGHVENFNDPLTECKKCHFRFRADQFLEDGGLWQEGLSINEMNGVIKNNKLKCPKCGGELSEVRMFNMMFPVAIGQKEEKAYLSPETAQGAYLTFPAEFEATRKKLPLGIAIIDKAFRNEISPRQLFFRLREFTQAELQIFFDPAKFNEIEEEKWKEVQAYRLKVKFAKDKKISEISCDEIHKREKIPKMYLFYAAKIQEFYLGLLGIPEKKFRFRELGEEERAFYNKIHFDIELELDTIGGFKEVAGLHYRGSHDLEGHAKQSKKDLSVFHEEKKVLPHVLELSFGVDRNVYAFLDIFFKQEREGEKRDLFTFPDAIAPIKAAVFPLVNKDGIDKKAEEVYEMLKRNIACFYDDSGSIGRRYRRQDEIGTIITITIDYQTLKDDTVTIRNRDSMKQERVKIKDIEKKI